MGKTKQVLFSTRSVEVGDFSIDIRSSNPTNLKTIILVHGIGVSEKYFRRLADKLAPHYYIISVNLPGYGETKKPPYVLNLDETAEVVAQFIRLENILHPTIIGHSMGCQIAARLGLMKDLAIDKLILLSPTVNSKERTAPLQFLRLMQDILREPLAVNSTLFLDYIKFGFVRYLKTQRYMIADEMETHLAKCLLPTLILRGERDKIVPRDWAVFLSTLLKKGSFVEIKAGPHNIQSTHTKEVADACINFIEQ